MRLLLHIAFCSLAAYCCSQPGKSLHSYTATGIDGQTIKLSSYYGKKLMIVNTASYCQFTQQFALLQQLYKIFKPYDFEIVGFPSNDFGSQDPGSDSVIHDFCLANYGVTFQMMSKVSVSSGDTASIYKWLQRSNLNGVKNVSVDWNFNKFLVDESGRWVKHYGGPVSPFEKEITDWILSPSSLTGTAESREEDRIKLVSANPSSTTIELVLNSPQICTLTLFALDGKKVASLYQGQANINQKISYDISGLDAGIYLLTANAGNFTKHMKLMVSH